MSADVQGEAPPAVRSTTKRELAQGFPACPHHHRVRDDRRGEVYCSDCGLVVRDVVLYGPPPRVETSYSPPRLSHDEGRPTIAGLSRPIWGLDSERLERQRFAAIGRVVASI
ncbi:MAG: TFIIB-type zinc ribbon-containing protein, partial [Thermoplasmata archaeon]